MKKISFWLFIFAFATFTSSIARGQDTATQQQIDQINGRIQDLIDAQAAQGKKLADLEKSIGDLGDKLNQPVINNSASSDDLKKLAEQVKDLAKKQQDDNDLVLKEFEKLAKAGGGVSASGRKAATPVPAPTTGGSVAGEKQNGFYYEIQPNNTISAIAKAYSEGGHKVTAKQILDANPGLDAKNLIVGKKIFIPDTSAK
jgi:phage tail protein X